MMRVAEKHDVAFMRDRRRNQSPITIFHTVTVPVGQQDTMSLPQNNACIRYRLRLGETITITAHRVYGDPVLRLCVRDIRQSITEKTNQRRIPM